MASNTLTFTPPTTTRLLSGLGAPSVMLMMLAMVVVTVARYGARHTVHR